MTDILSEHRSAQPEKSINQGAVPPDSLQVAEAVGYVDKTEDLAGYFHRTMFTIELCAAEVCAAIVAMNPIEAPAGLLSDLCRQIADEFRHFAALQKLMVEAGGYLGQDAIDVLVWRKFLLAESLAEQIAIEQRIGEGVGLDGGLAAETAFVDMGHTAAAATFGYINADELNHVRNGNRWLVVLLGSVSKVEQLDAEMRARLAANGLEVPRIEPPNIRDRRLAGFRKPDLC